MFALKDSNACRRSQRENESIPTKLTMTENKVFKVPPALEEQRWEPQASWVDSLKNDPLQCLVEQNINAVKTTQPENSSNLEGLLEAEIPRAQNESGVLLHLPQFLFLPDFCFTRFLLGTELFCFLN